MEDNTRTDLNELIRPDSQDVSSQLKKVASLPELKPHFIVKEYCGRARRESQTVYLEEKFNRDTTDRDVRDDLVKHTHQHRQSRGLIERFAFIGGAVVGGAIGLYIYGSGGNGGE